MLRSTPMPIIHAAEKRMRADRKRRERNLRVASELKSLTRKLLKGIQEGQAAQAKEVYHLLTKRLDQATSKGILHKNTASRKKSRLARQLQKQPVR